MKHRLVVATRTCAAIALAIVFYGIGTLNSRYPSSAISGARTVPFSTSAAYNDAPALRPATCNNVVVEDSFSSIYERGGWAPIRMKTVTPRHYYSYGKMHPRTSMSGPGSDTGGATEISLKFLAETISNYSIRTMLDIPCGDVNWQMDAREVDALELYVGADVTKSVIALDRERFAHHRNKLFVHWDFVSCPLPKISHKAGDSPFDLVHSRDVLQHLKLADAVKAAHNLLNSGARYLIVTTYPEGVNTNLPSTGMWFQNNLELPPFSFPKPLLCTPTHPKVEGDSTCLYKLR